MNRESEVVAPSREARALEGESDDTSETSLRAAASRSLFWTAAGKYLPALLSLGVGAILARVLSPADFGLTALVAVLSGFLTVLAEAGVSTTIVQQRDMPHAGLSSLFWTSVGLGALMTVAMAAGAPWVARYGGDPRLAGVTAALGFGFLFAGMGKVPTGLLRRALDFRALAASDFFAALVAGVVGVAAALLGAGYWALVLQSLTNSLLMALIRLRLSRFVPAVTFDLRLVGSASRYSSGVLAFDVINYWARNLDKALIGRFMGAAELGFYSRAYGLMLVPLDALNGILNPILHPLLTRIQDDRARMARLYVNITKLVACLALPAMVVLAALAPELVHVLWGNQWERAVDVFAILCIVGSVQPVSATFGSVFLATGRSRFLALVGLINACVTMAGIALGVRYGIEGVAIGYGCAYAITFLPTLYVVVVVLLGGAVRDFAKIFGTALALALAVFCAMTGYNLLLRGRWLDGAHLVVGILLGVVVWGATFLVVDRKHLAEAAELLPPRIRSLLARVGVQR